MKRATIALVIAVIVRLAAAAPTTPGTNISFELIAGTPGKPGFKTHELPVYAPPGKEVLVSFKAKKPIDAAVSGGTDCGILAGSSGADVTVRFKMSKFGEVRIYVSSLDGSADKVEATVVGGSFPSDPSHWYFNQTKEPNKALVPTATSVTPAADAPVAPAAAAAHL